MKSVPGKEQEKTVFGRKKERSVLLCYCSLTYAQTLTTYCMVVCIVVFGSHVFTVISEINIKLISELIKALKENNVQANNMIKWINNEAINKYNNIVAVKVADFAKEHHKG